MVRADDWFEQTFTRLKERDSLHDLDYEMRRKDGTTFSVLVNVVAIKDTDGRFVRSHAISLAFESADAMPLAAPLAGQFVVLRMRPPHATSPLMRSYSLSAAPNASQYRVSVKCEAAGAAGAYLDRQVNVGGVLEASAPRAAFTLKPDARPLVLASAGIGITPVLAILHVLAAERSMREIWWLYGARNREHHPFALASRRLDL